jgi:AcrR family transcriptional regulator
MTRSGGARMPRPEREEQMLEVAGGLFAARGYAAVSMEDIAAEVGVSKPMIYNYFGSKQGLYIAYVERAGRELLDRMRNAEGAGRSPEQRLRSGVDAFFGYVDEHRDGWAVLYKEAATQGGPFAAEVAALRGRIRGIVNSLFAEATGAPPAAKRDNAATEPLAAAFVGAGEALANWWLEHPQLSREAVSEILTNFAAGALAPRRRPPRASGDPS